MPITFYSDAERKTKIDFTANEAEVGTGTVALADVATAKTVELYWAWDSASDDTADTTLGETPVDGTITLDITAEQYIEPETPVTP